MKQPFAAPPPPPPPAPPPKPEPGPVPPPPFAWQPFTFSGVAAFARAGLGRIMLAQIIAAALATAVVVWVLGHDYAPVLTRAIQKLPEEAMFRNATIQGVPDRLVSESKFISIAIETEDDGPIDQSADVQIEFRHDLFRVCSLFRSATGCLEFPYPPERYVNLHRSVAEPWWGAWQPIILAGAGLLTLISLMLTWVLLALLYSPVPLLLAWFANRHLTWSGSWKLAAAALLPGSAMMAAGIFLYGVRAIDLIGLIFFFCSHFVTGWVYLIGAPFFAPALTVEKAGSNPFSDPPAAPQQESSQN